MTTLRGAAVAAPPRDAPPATRDAYWDNVRFVAMALVVVGHAVEGLSDSPAMYALYLLIYAFHMPLFALASGFFARAEPLTRADGAKTVVTLLVPYVVFTALWSLTRWADRGEWSFDLGSPYWHLWFLTALVAWRLSLPVLAALRHPVLWAVAIAVASGYMGSVGWRFDAARTLGFLPFFVLGWALRSGAGWQRFRALTSQAWVKAAALVVLVAACAASLALVDLGREWGLRAWVQVERNYADLGVTSWAAGLGRLAAVLVATLLCAAVLALVPSRRSRVSDWGRATMYVYLLHLFPLYFLRPLPWYEGVVDDGPGQAGIVLGAVVLTAVLATRPVIWATRWLIEPRWARRLLARDLRG